MSVSYLCPLILSWFTESKDILTQRFFNDFQCPGKCSLSFISLTSGEQKVRSLQVVEGDCGYGMCVCLHAGCRVWGLKAQSVLKLWGVKKKSLPSANPVIWCDQMMQWCKVTLISYNEVWTQRMLPKLPPPSQLCFPAHINRYSTSPYCWIIQWEIKVSLWSLRLASAHE